MTKTIQKYTRAVPKTPTPGRSVSQAQLIRANNTWRDQYNPLRGLGIRRIVQMLEAGERGEFAELQWLYRFIEKRFAVLRSLIVRRRAALAKLDWDIKVPSELPAGATARMAEQQRQFLHARYELVRNLKETVRFLSLAEFRGYSILQKHRLVGGPNDGAVCEFHWLPQWNFVRNGQFGGWYWNPQAAQTTARSLGSAAKLDPADFLIREVEMPINEIAAFAFVNCSMAKKDWAAFVEMFGLAGCVVEMPPNIPAGKEAEYEQAAKAVAEGGSGAVPSGSSATFPSSAVRGNSPFKEFVDAEKEDVVLAGTGGKLTMLTAATGMNNSQGDVHDAAFDDLAQDEAAEISELLNCQFTEAELELQFPGQPKLAYFELAAQDQEDVNALVERIATLETAGYTTDVEQVSEKTNLKLTRSAPVADPALPPVPPILNRDGAPAAVPAATVQAYALARARDLQPLRDRLARIQQIQDPALLQQKLQDFRASLPQLLKDINANPAAAQPLLALTTRAMAQGLASGAAEVAAAGAPIKNRAYVLGEEPPAAPILNFAQNQPRDSLGRWVDANGGGLSQRHNLERGKKALARALRTRADVPKAMYKRGIGEIGFNWGTPGRTQPNAAGVTHTNGRGISHMLAKHPQELKHLPEVIAKGKVYAHENPAKRYIIHGPYAAVVERENTKRAWMVTHFTHDPAGLESMKQAKKNRPSTKRAGH